jgi:hypothetical protein
MRYLNEHECGFHVDGIGFPSISGCHAIVLNTDNGCFGYHNAGGSAETSWKTRAEAFAGYVRNHFYYGAKHRRLYGVTFVDDARGYSLDQSRDKSWKQELETFASELGYGGKIRGFNLSKTALAGGSAYVELRRTGEKCEIWVKRWADADRTTGPVAERMHHQMIHLTEAGTKVTIKDRVTVVTNVTTAGLVHVASTRLRG